MKNIYILPTEKPSRLYYNSQERTFQLCEFPKYHTDIKSTHNLYITNDEEIKEGDWVVQVNFEKTNTQIIHCIKEFQVKIANDKNGSFTKSKIILTTDTQLIADGVQAIDDNFLEWFVKNPSCEKVETFIDTMGCSLESCDGNPCVNYKIIIPQEEPKQETLEEAVEDYTDTPSLDNIKLAFRNGAKWQQEAILDLLKVNGYEDDPIFDLITEQFKKK
jgi:hypothetical protein